jgi:transcriptional regulator with XRE-family HTH domain
LSGLRGRTGLTQREIATKLGVHVRSVQLWEAAASHPNARRLEALIVLFLESDAFADGLELDEADALWTAASTESARLNAPFDAARFTRLLHARRAATRPVPVATRTGGHNAWGNAPDVERFVGRTPERVTLRHWVLDDRCRVIGVLGMGGIGKTLLATRLARDEEARFEHVYWRGLHNAPSFGDWLAGALGVLSPHDPALSAGEAQRIDRLLEVVHQSPSLLIIDNFETVLQTGERFGEYLPGCTGYGRLLKLLAETPHQSCVLLTSREEPPELGPLKGSDVQFAP